MEKGPCKKICIREKNKIIQNALSEKKDIRLFCYLRPMGRARGNRILHLMTEAYKICKDIMKIYKITVLVTDPYCDNFTPLQNNHSIYFAIQ